MKTIGLKNSILFLASFFLFSLKDVLSTVDRSSNTKKAFDPTNIKQIAKRENGQQNFPSTCDCFFPVRLLNSLSMTVTCTKLLAHPYQLQLHYDLNNPLQRINAVIDNQDYCWIHWRNGTCNMLGIKTERENQFYFAGLHFKKPGLHLIPGGKPTILDCSQNDRRFIISFDGINGRIRFRMAFNGEYIRVLKSTTNRFITFTRVEEKASEWDVVN